MWESEPFATLERKEMGNDDEPDDDELGDATG